MGNINRTFLLGAGFSKALADGPLMKDIWTRIENAYEQEKNKLKGKNRSLWFKRLVNFIKRLEEQATSEFTKNEIDRVEIRENIEYLFTLIELHLMKERPKIQFKKEGADISPYPAIPFPTSNFELEEIKSYFLTYLYIILERLKTNHLANKFAGVINEVNDKIITFNYDLVLEKALWDAGIWSPLDGYVGVYRFEKEEDKRRLEEASKHSQLKIHKMHGSINWNNLGIIGCLLNNDIVIEMDNIESGGFHFDGLEKILSRPPKLSEPYEGKHSPPWMLPSFIKPFEKQEFYEIWKSALKVMSKTDELIIIGYSFRLEDSNSYLLLPC